MAKIRTAFVAGNHRAWFSKKYPNYKTIEVAEIDPVYMRWCIDNLKHLRFADRIHRRVNKLLNTQSNPTP